MLVVRVVNGLSLVMHFSSRMPFLSYIFAPPLGIFANNSSAGMTLFFINKISDCSQKLIMTEKAIPIIKIIADIPPTISIGFLNFFLFFEPLFFFNKSFKLLFIFPLFFSYYHKVRDTKLCKKIMF